MKHQQTLRCRVTAYNLSPRGDVDGLLVEVDGRPAQVVFPPHEGAEVVKSVEPGQALDVVVEAEPPSPEGDAAHPVYRFASLPGAADPVRGVVARLNYARHGEPNGVVLDTGDSVHLKPDGMRKLGSKVGDRVEATGEARPMDLGGRAVEATAVNGVTLKGKHS